MRDNYKSLAWNGLSCPHGAIGVNRKCKIYHGTWRDRHTRSAESPANWCFVFQWGCESLHRTPSEKEKNTDMYIEVVVVPIKKRFDGHEVDQFQHWFEM